MVAVALGAAPQVPFGRVMAVDVFRSGLHYLANQREVQRLVTGSSLPARLARRFVAGERLHEAVEAVRQLNARGLSASLDYLGESTTRAEETDQSADIIVSILDTIARERIDANVSLKLTQLGLGLDDARCRRHVERIVARGAELDIFVRFDMEGSAYTQATLELFYWINERYPNRSGPVIQSYLRRSAEDIERLNAIGARVRLCKGAYDEPESVAFPDKRDVDRSYVRLAKALLERGNYPGIATHDESIIRFVKDFTRRHGIGAERFEFQMLYGVRRDLQEALRGEGYRMRIYTPFGEQWYPYFMRRLAERPANVAFLLSSLTREGRSRRPD